MQERYDPLQSIAEQADKIMLGVLAALLLFSFALAAVNQTWGLALLIGLPSAAIPVLLHFNAPGALQTR